MPLSAEIKESMPVSLYSSETIQAIEGLGKSLSVSGLQSARAGQVYQELLPFLDPQTVLNPRLNPELIRLFAVSAALGFWEDMDQDPDHARCSDALIAYYIQNRRVREVAQQSGVRENIVYNDIVNGLNYLLEKFSDEPEDIFPYDFNPEDAFPSDKIQGTRRHVSQKTPRQSKKEEWAIAMEDRSLTTRASALGLLVREPRATVFALSTHDFSEHGIRLPILDAALGIVKQYGYFSATLLRDELGIPLSTSDAEIEKVRKSIKSAIENAGGIEVALANIPSSFGEVLRSVITQRLTLAQITQLLNANEHDIGLSALSNYIDGDRVPRAPKDFINSLSLALNLTNQDRFLLYKQLALELVRRKVNLLYAVSIVFSNYAEFQAYQDAWAIKSTTYNPYIHKTTKRLDTLDQRLYVLRTTKKLGKNSTARQLKLHPKSYTQLEEEGNIPSDPIAFAKAAAKIFAESSDDPKARLMIEQDLIRAAGMSILKKAFGDDFKDLLFPTLARKLRRQAGQNPTPPQP